MSATPPTPHAPGGPNRRLLIGLGAGCGCLSLIMGILAVLIVITILTPRPQAGPSPEPIPAPRPSPGPGPQPQPSPPARAVEGPPEFQVRAVTVKVQGQPPDAQPAGETDTYAQGEVVGLAGEFVVVRGPQTFVLVWIKIRDGRPSPVVEPKEFKVSEGDAGKKFFFTLRGADAGDYAVGLVRPAGGNQYQPIVIRRFKVQ